MTIKQKQHLLAYLGYYKGAVDGEWGPKSQEATRAFQHATGLDPDGVFGPKTEARILQAVARGEFAKAEPAKDPAGNFWDSIKHFTRAEFKCTCGGRGCNGYPVEPNEKLIKAADKVRTHFNAKVIVSSGVRCTLRNSELPGSVSNSRHLSGKAMDFCVSGFSASSVLPYVQSLPEIRYAYEINSNYVHMDIL
jgi:hypothetical protein